MVLITPFTRTLGPEQYPGIKQKIYILKQFHALPILQYMIFHPIIGIDSFFILPEKHTHMCLLFIAVFLLTFCYTR